MFSTSSVQKVWKFQSLPFRNKLDNGVEIFQGVECLNTVFKERNRAHLDFDKKFMKCSENIFTDSLLHRFVK